MTRLTQYTFSGGETILIRRVASLLLDDFNDTLPRPPAPPKQVVHIGAEQREELIENLEDPDYKDAFLRHQKELGTRMIEFLVEYGVEGVELDAAELAHLRAFADKTGMRLPADDKVCYVTRLLAVTQADLVGLREALLGRVQPTEAGIAQAIQKFPADV